MKPIEHVPRGDARVRAVGYSVLGGLLLLLGGLWFVQIVSAHKYSSRIQKQTFRTVRVPAVRGKIYDRAGVVLAENRPSYNLVLYIDELRSLFNQEYTRLRDGRRLNRLERRALARQARYDVASNLVQRLGGVVGTNLTLDPRAYDRHHHQWPYRPFPILENLTPEQVARFLERAEYLPGVDLEVLPLRHYPHGPMAAHVLGYLTRDDQALGDEERPFNYSQPTYQGAVGIEWGFDADLRGKPGLKSVVVDSLCYREGETTWKTAVPGRNVRLALDVELQQASVKALRTLGAYVRGAVVVLDVTNGDVLAMVSAPAYDPNEFLAPISATRWEEWMNNPIFRPIFNRATQGAYPPGSIFKLVTALACFDRGVLTFQNLTNQFENPGYFRIGHRRIDDTAPPGRYDFVRAFKRSSNTYFIEHGLRAGLAALLEAGHRFFLGEKFGLPTRQEVAGFFPSVKQARRRWGRGNVANVCIGQEITVTPLQMAVMTAAVANGGRVFAPRLVLQVEPAEASLGQRTTTFSPQVRGTLKTDPKFLALLRRAMLADTEEREGTAFRAFHTRDRRTPLLKHFRVGGKTGTAEIEREGRKKDKITWFASFGPFEHPRYAVVVMIEGGASGGRTCAPVARRIYQFIEQRERTGLVGNPSLALAR
jgi:penicillin-binding protein 2